MTRRIQLILTTLVVGLTLVLGTGCGKPTAEGQKARFDRAKDALDILSTKMPAMKADITAKVAEFDTQFKEAQAQGGEAGVTAMGSVVRRMEDYEKKLNPQKAAGTTAPQPPGSKLTAPAGQPGAPGGKLGVPAAAAPAPGGKLGAPAPAGSAPAPGGKLGAPAAAAPAPAPAAAPTPAPAPAGTAPAPTGGSGFGGK